MNNKELEKQLNEIKKRNQRVELDKKWETSYTRRIIAIFSTRNTIRSSARTTKVQRHIKTTRRY